MINSHAWRAISPDPIHGHRAEPGPGIPFETPAPERVDAFQSILRRSMQCFVRKPPGLGVYAA